ncbi:hypothetical protein [uncultured Bifidobacterium sp.]|uniref:hypothetical protein n=1 Tax=uncultured Bifidobacterium sp. TaxID=165187 RepID=UPI00260575D1|nr:hypothetical protein [uncultured Bifidobacterium sp.]
MALNPTGNDGGSRNEHNWNYSRPDQPGFSTELVGTVVAIQETQAMNFGQNGPTTPKFWPNGNPVWNIRVTLAGPSGGYRTFTFAEAGKAQREGKKPSVHIDLFKLAGGKDMMDLIGKTIKISTQQPPQGFAYGRGCPRPWHVEEVAAGPFQLAEALPPFLTVPQLLADDAAHGGQVVGNQRTAMPDPVMQPQVGYSPQPTQQQYQPVQQQTSVQASEIPVDTGFSNPQDNWSNQSNVVPQVAPGTPVPTSVYDESIPF